MLKILDQKMTATAGRFLILLLVAGFVFSNSALNLGKNEVIESGEPGLANVIQNIKNLERIDSSKQASQQMRAMIIALQSASGLLVTRKLPGQDSSEVVVVFFKLPFLFSSSAAVSNTINCADLAPVDWNNNYTSIKLSPPSPPPLYLS